MPEMKTCFRCKGDFPADTLHFHSDRRKKDGLTSACRECMGVGFLEPEPFVEEGFKVCTTCGEALPKTSQYFMPRKSGKDGFRGQCRVCRMKKQNEHTDNNREAITERRSIYWQANREYFSEKKKVYQQENKEPIAIRKRVYRELNKEPISEYGRMYYANNSDSIKLKNNKYHRENKEKVGIYRMRRQAKKLKLARTLTNEQWENAKLHFNNKCAFCNKEVPLTKEHLVPVHSGGEFTSQNIIPSCLSCNCSKQASEWKTWFHRQPTYSLDKENKILTYLGYKDNKQQLALF